MRSRCDSGRGCGRCPRPAQPKHTAERLPTCLPPMPSGFLSGLASCREGAQDWHPRESGACPSFPLRKHSGQCACRPGRPPVLCALSVSVPISNLCACVLWWVCLCGTGSLSGLVTPARVGASLVLVAGPWPHPSLSIWEPRGPLGVLEDSPCWGAAGCVWAPRRGQMTDGPPLLSSCLPRGHCPG